MQHPEGRNCRNEILQINFGIPSTKKISAVAKISYQINILLIYKIPKSRQHLIENLFDFNFFIKFFFIFNFTVNYKQIL